MQKMTEVYNEIYDFQFEPIETKATYMQARTGVYAAQDMSQNYEEFAKKNPTSGDVNNLMKKLAFVTHITYEVQKWKIVEEYCNVLEYQNGGSVLLCVKAKIQIFNYLLPRNQLVAPALLMLMLTSQSKKQILQQENMDQMERGRGHQIKLNMI